MSSDESIDVKGTAVPLVIVADPAMTVEQSAQWVVDNQPALETLLKVGRMCCAAHVEPDTNPP